MARRKRSANVYRSYDLSPIRRSTRPSRTISVSLPVPVSVNLPRTVNYTYPSPQQRRTRVVRTSLVKPRGRLRTVRFRIRLPNHLPVLPASHVSVRRGKINVHSARQTRRLLDKEYNRRRYQEHKTRKRKARDGQLASLRSDRYGLVGAAYFSGKGARTISDAALVSRALGV